MPSRLSFGSKVFCKILGLTLVVLGFSASPAFAGFEAVGFQWVPPEAAPAATASPEPNVSAPSMPGAANQAPEPLAPVIIGGNTTPTGDAAIVSGPPSLSGAPNTNDMSAGPIVHGFANNVPLAVALREVLPPGYNFSIDQSVDMGTPVSFQGGKPWRETLQGMLQTADLSMREDNRMVYITKTVPMPSLSAAPLGVPEGMPAATSMQPLPSVVTMEPSALAPMPAPLSAVSAGPGIDTWTAQRDDTLHKVLENWCRRSNVELDWLAEYDYPLEASITITGTFETAVRNLLSGFEDAHPQPIAELHNNQNAGQKVLVVQTRGNSYSD